MIVTAERCPLRSDPHTCRKLTRSHPHTRISRASHTARLCAHGGARDWPWRHVYMTRHTLTHSLHLPRHVRALPERAPPAGAAPRCSCAAHRTPSLLPACRLHRRALLKSHRHTHGSLTRSPSPLTCASTSAPSALQWSLASLDGPHAPRMPARLLYRRDRWSDGCSGRTRCRGGMAAPWPGWSLLASASTRRAASVPRIVRRAAARARNTPACRHQ